MAQDMTQFTHLGRPLDPRYPTNRIISLYCAIIFPIIFFFMLLSGETLIQSGIQAIIGSLSVFFVWAFSREIDPKEQLSAFVPVVFMSIALFVVDTQFNLLILFYLMIAVRIVNRTVGLPAKLSDSIGILIATSFIAFILSWQYATIALLAFALDSRLPEASSKNLWFAIMTFVILVIAFVMEGASIAFLLPTPIYLGAIILIGLIFIPVILKSKALPKGDATDETLMPIRVQSGQIMTLIFAYFIALWRGDAGILEFLPLWFCIAGVSVFPLIKPFLPNWSLEKRSRKPSA